MAIKKLVVGIRDRSAEQDGDALLIR